MTEYKVEFKPKSIMDLKHLPLKQTQLIIEKIELMSINLAGDIKNLQIIPLNTV